MEVWYRSMLEEHAISSWQGTKSKKARGDKFSDGTLYYYWARKEGLLPTNHSVHASVRSTLELRVYRSSPFLPIDVDGVLRRTREIVPDAERYMYPWMLTRWI